MKNSTLCTALEGVLNKLREKDFNLLPYPFEYMAFVKRAYEKYPKKELVHKTLYMLLLQLRCQSPVMFDLYVESFPEYRNIEDAWKKHGYRSIDGFIWLVPKR